MGIKNLVIGEGFGKGLKTLSKVIVTGTLVVSMMAPVPASAHVDTNKIVPDDHYLSGLYDRDEMRECEARMIDEKFNGLVTIEDVSAAIMLSDQITSVVPFDLSLKNTSFDEVNNINPSVELQSYELACVNGFEYHKAMEMQPSLAAIDAYTVFGCNTVSEHIKKSLSNIILNIFNSTGNKYTKCEIVCDEYNFYAILSNRISLVKVDLVGDYITGIRDRICVLEDTYSTAINDIKGDGNETLDSFSYNGFNKRNGKSVWLSLGSDQRKDYLSSCIDEANDIMIGTGYSYDCSNYYDNCPISREEKDMLVNMGYSYRQLRNSKECNLHVVKELDYTMK